MEIAPGVHAVRLLNVYSFLISEPEMTLIDAGLIGSRRRVERYVSRLGRSISELTRIVCTHAHPDHIGGVREMAGQRDVEVLMHPADLAGLRVTLRDAVANRNRGQLIAYFTRHPGEATPIEDGHLLPILGGLQVIHTPGHTPGSLSFYTEGMLFSGDTLFQGSIGRTDLPGGDYRQEMASIVDKLLSLPDDTIVLPGHMQETRIGFERQANPFVLEELARRRGE
jgi:glyoxylase-like metal-dependent hydrolase (beta-lactamase superfamily II)